MKILLWLCGLFLCFSLHAQENKGNTVFYLGAKTRITPIYLKRLPDHIFTPRVSDLEQPDKHVSGPGIEIIEAYTFARNYKIAFHQVIRHDFLYQTVPVDYPPPPDFKYEIKRRVIFDFYLDAVRVFPKDNCNWSVSAGFALCGLNTNYTETVSATVNPNTYLEKKKDFVFTALTAGVGFQKKKIFTEIKMGYCWDDPRLINTPFLFPELSIQYQLFHFPKK